MAKRKTKKIVDLKPKSVSENDLNQLRTLVGAINENRLQIGILETQKHTMLHQQGALAEQLTKFQDQLLDEYGTFNIDINTGEIKSNENDETNKKD